MAKPAEQVNLETSGVGRREFIRRAMGGVVAPSVAGLVAACSEVDPMDPTGSTLQRRTSPVEMAPLGAGGYGPVDRDKGPLILPRGFQVHKFGRVGMPMSDGNTTPLAHDGMAAFAAARNRVRLVRNHEDRNGSPTPPISSVNAYDRLAGGGTTTLEIGPNRELERDWVSLSGTIVNCAGGPTPWGSWLSCEEAVDGTREGFEKTHGWVFEVPSSAEGPVVPVPLKDMGRFRHEAVAIDPRSGIVYETEDNVFGFGQPGSGFYRFLPNDPRNLAAGGTLQMLKIEGAPNIRLFEGGAVDLFQDLQVTWVDIPEPAVDPNDEMVKDDRKHAVFDQGAEQGAAVFNRLEGCWFGDGSVFFHDTVGGSAREGQVWEYIPGAGESGGRLRLIFESPGADVLDNPDNITVSPRGGLVLCEDGSNVQYLRGLTQGGELFDFAINNVNDTEFAGACFSPDGQTLFVNIQGSTRGTAATAEPGWTLAIWGPWSKGAL